MPYSTELRRNVEDLALKLVMEPPPAGEAAPVTSGWLAELERIRSLALAEKAQAVADRAVAAIEACTRSGGADTLQEGITALQEALDREPSAAAPSSLAQDQELLGDFVVESREHLGSIEAQTLTLERDPNDSEALNSVFRGFHTIKGLAGFLELWEMQKLAHEVETLLDLARNSQLTLSAAAIDVILKSADQLRRWLSYLEDGLRGRPSQKPSADDGLLQAIREAAIARDPVPEPASDLLALASAVTPDHPAPEVPAPHPVTAAAPPVPNANPAPAAAAQQAAPPAPGPQTASNHNESIAVRVDTTKLDSLVDMAGELVIAESLVRHDPELGQLKSQVLQRKIAQLNRITAELQKTAMAMRLIPIGPLFRRMARLVRDLSRQFGKRVDMESQGDDIELDRTIVEQLADPLMHMVRNALDHGIETPKEREQAGKAPQARLTLRASHQAGQVVIEVSDDGRGLNRDKIRAKAIERGLIQASDTLSDNEVCNLIFEPGFTTASQLTSVSGRGVGMDVVRKHVERLRGRIELRSKQGQGSTFLMKLPLTLAIIDGLVVGVGRERYVVPMFAVREMFRPSADCIWSVQQRAEMALVRGSLLPVVRLYRRFGVTPVSEDPLQSVLVVAESGDQRFCLLVDELIGKQEVVIKSLGELFHGVAGVAGGAILGDGRVGLILDVERLFKEGSVEPIR
jgi:two-component system, chemotaxis family, sensor kinase CheA